MKPRSQRSRRALLAGASSMFLLTGCHGAFLGEDFQAKALPQRPVNAWPLLEMEEDPDTGESRSLGLASFIYYHDEPNADATHAAAFPFYWHAREGDASRTRVPPFYLQSRNGEDYDVSVLGVDEVALYSRHVEGDRRRTHLFPFIWHWGTASAGTVLAVPGFYVSTDEDTTHLSWLGFLADHRSAPEESETYVLGWGPASLAHRRKSETASTSHILPLYWHARDEVSEFRAILPLYFSHANHDTGSTRQLLFPFVHAAAEGEKERLDVLYPLYHSEDTGPDESHWSSLFYLASWDREDAETYDFRILYKLFRKRESPGRSEVELTPIFTISSDEADEADEGYYSFSLLGPLYRYERRGEETTHRFFHFIRI